jgi:hypothetical protein
MVSVEPRDVTGKFASFDVRTGLLDVLLAVSSRAQHDNWPQSEVVNGTPLVGLGKKVIPRGGREQFETRAQGLTRLDT